MRSKLISFLLFTLTVVLIISSCTKDDPPLPSQPVFPTDSLGTGWTKISNYEFGLDIFFTDSLNGYLAGAFQNFKTTNGGVSWDTLPFLQLSDIGAFDENHVTFVGVTKAHSTTDGGANWNTTSFTPGITNCFYLAEQKILYSCANGIYMSQDGGNTFTKKYARGYTFEYSSIFFFDSNNGWIAYKDSIFRTVDGGMGWTRLKSPSDSIIFTEFVSTTTGYANAAGYIYKTTDGGNTWTTHYRFPEFSALNDIDFVSATIGFASSGNSIYKTTNGGVSWQRMLRLRDEIIEIHFTDEGHGWACGKSGVYRYVKP